MDKNKARRDFLKLASLSATSALCLPGRLEALGEYALKGSDKWVNTVCEMCSSRCLMKARVIDGKVTFLEGNVFAPMMGTSLCARGIAGASQLYDKERLIKPLVRVGKPLA